MIREIAQKAHMSFTDIGVIIRKIDAQILREYGKQFTQITERYSDGRNGRCAIGVIMSLRMIEVKQNGLCFSCGERIAHNHVVVSSGRPRRYYHIYCSIRFC